MIFRCQVCGELCSLFSYFCEHCSDIRRMIMLFGNDKILSVLKENMLKVDISNDQEKPVKEPVNESVHESCKSETNENKKSYSQVVGELKEKQQTKKKSN